MPKAPSIQTMLRLGLKVYKEDLLGATCSPRVRAPGFYKNNFGLRTPNVATWALRAACILPSFPNGARYTSKTGLDPTYMLGVDSRT